MNLATRFNWAACGLGALALFAVVCRCTDLQARNERRPGARSFGVSLVLDVARNDGRRSIGAVSADETGPWLTRFPGLA
jgi:hypothetical protein